jgi:hypothetical protein
LGCSSNSPLLSSSVVRDLGETFCKLDKASLSNEALNAKLSKKGVVGRPKNKKSKKEDGAKKDDTGLDEGPSKNNKA